MHVFTSLGIFSLVDVIVFVWVGAQKFKYKPSALTKVFKPPARLSFKTANTELKRPKTEMKSHEKKLKTLQQTNNTCYFYNATPCKVKKQSQQPRKKKVRRLVAFVILLLLLITVLLFILVKFCTSVTIVTNVSIVINVRECQILTCDSRV